MRRGKGETSGKARLWWAALIVFGGLGCVGERGAAPGEEPSGFVGAVGTEGRGGGSVVARVQGRAVFARDVAAVAAREGLPLRDALDREVARILLLREAHRRGVARRTEVREAARRISVQRLLYEEVEARVVEVPERAVRARFERRKEALARPEERFVAHVTFKPVVRSVQSDGEAAPVDAVDGGAGRATGEDDAAWAVARRHAEALLEEVGAAEDPAHALVEGWDRWRERLGEGLVRFERMPPVHRDDPLLPEFLDAVFALERPGLVPNLVRTRYGWHVIVVEHIRLARGARYEDVAEELRKEISIERRRERLAELLRDLRARFGVRLREASVRTVLAHLSIEEGGEGAEQ